MERKEPTDQQAEFRDNRDSFLTLNSPNPADLAGYAIGGEDAISSAGFRARSVWSRSAQEMLDHVTRDWRNHYVTADIVSYEELQTFVIRPFVLVVRLDAPILERFRRMTRYATPSSVLGGLILIISLDSQAGEASHLVGEIHHRP